MTQGKYVRKSSGFGVGNGFLVTVCDACQVAQSCPTLCNPVDYTVRGILQAKILEWVAFPSSRGSSQLRDRAQVSCIAGNSLPAEPPGKPLGFSQAS